MCERWFEEDGGGRVCALDVPCTLECQLGTLGTLRGSGHEHLANSISALVARVEQSFCKSRMFRGGECQWREYRSRDFVAASISI